MINKEDKSENLNNWKPVLGPGEKPSPGWMEGAQAALNDKLKLGQNRREEGYLGLAGNKDKREERYLNMDEEKFSWDRDDRNKSLDMEKGMTDAMQMGGYNGVIDFLKTADPKKAMEFTNAKLDLDQKMMKSDVMAALVPTQKAAAMAEGYNIIGKMGVAILRAPERDRDAMYKNILPILKQVNPEAPDTLNDDAVAMFQLGGAQAMPASTLFQANKDEVTSKTALGKLDLDIKSRVANGETAENSPILKTMMKQYEAENNKLEAATETLNGLTYDELAKKSAMSKNEAQANSAKYALTSKLGSDYNKESKSFLDFNDSKLKFDAAAKAIASGAGAPAQASLFRIVGLMFNKGVFSETDAAAYSGSDDFARQGMKLVRSIVNSGGQIVLNKSEVERLTTLMDRINSGYQAKQQKVNSRYEGLASKYNVDKADLPLVSVSTPDYYMGSDVPDNIKNDAKAAIEKGANREAVNARVKEMMSTKNE